MQMMGGPNIPLGRFGQPVGEGEAVRRKNDCLIEEKGHVGQKW